MILYHMSFNVSNVNNSSIFIYLFICFVRRHLFNVYGRSLGCKLFVNFQRENTSRSSSKKKKSVHVDYFQYSSTPTVVLTSCISSFLCVHRSRST